MYGNPETQLSGKQELFEEINNIYDYMTRNKGWHYNQFGLRSLGLRGFSRLHEMEAEQDLCSMIKLKKILEDRFNWRPTIDKDEYGKYDTNKVGSMQEFKSSFDVWKTNEEELVKCIVKAYGLASKEDVCLYKELICLADEVQDEIFRIDQIKSRLDLGQWNGHDLARVSKDIHKHLEEHKNLDFSLS